MSDEDPNDGLRAVLSRRAFLAGSAGLWLAASLPRPLAAAAARADASPRVLDPREWRLVEAITARILPTDDLPGAVEAGCVRFIDEALAAEDAAALPAYRAALRELDRVCRAGSGAKPGSTGSPGASSGSEPVASHATGEGAGFAELPPERQDELLAALEQGRLAGWNAAVADPVVFFATIRMHTLLGFVLDPRHGGNRDHLGWQVMGYPGPVHHLGGARPEQMIGEAPFTPIWERRSKPAH